MKLVNLYLEAFLLFLGAWVLSFELVNYGRLPFGDLYWVFPVALLLFLAPAFPGWRRTLQGATPGDWRSLFPLLLFGLILFTLSLFLSRPDLDDVGYLLQPLRDSLHPDQPLSWKTWQMPFSNATVYLQMLSKTEAYDPLAIILGTAFGLHPLTLYHNIQPIFLVFAWLAVYMLLLDRLGINGWRLWVGLLGLVLLLALDGTTHRSFGNFWLLRIWQGKVMLMTVLIPLLMLLTLRMLDRPRRRNGLLLALLIVTGPFISRSALFLFPLILLTFTASYLLVYRTRIEQIRPHARGAFGVLLSLLLIVAAAIFNLTVQEDAVSSTTDTAWNTLNKAYFPNDWVLLRDLSLLLLVPLVTLQGRMRLVFPLMTLLVTLLCFTPPWADWLHAILTKQAYWRLYYVLPIPLMFALLPIALTHKPNFNRIGLLRLTVTCVVVTTMVLAYQRPVLTRQNKVEIKWPDEHRIPRLDRLAMAHLHPKLTGKKVLAPHPLMAMLALKHYDTLDTSYGRMYSKNSGIIGEANRALRNCQIDQRSVVAIEQFIVMGAEVVIARACKSETFDKLRHELAGITLQKVDEGRDYVVFRVQPGAGLTAKRAYWRRKLADKLRDALPQP